MPDGLEQLLSLARQVWRRRWLCLAVAWLPLARRALERQPLPRQLPALVVAARRAAEPVGPALVEQPAGARRLVGEPGLELGQRSRPLGHPTHLPRARAQPIARRDQKG